MAYHELDQLRYYAFDLLGETNVVQGLFTRQGGISPAPWDSLNLGGTVGDSRENVIENRKRIFDHFGRPVESIFDVWQVHGTNVIASDTPRPLDGVHQKADAILTDRPEITLFMRFADCVPIFLHDPVRKVIGIVHAGWQGTVKKVCAVTVQAMADQYGCRPENILAGIGPSICVEQYEVRSDVADQVEQAFGSDAGALLQRQNGSIHLDLWEANRIILEQSGVRQIQVSGVCTASDTSSWYSHRAEGGKTGRFGALLALKAD
jgi:YfiH family protein